MNEIIEIDGKVASRSKHFALNRTYSEKTKKEMSERFTGTNNPSNDKQILNKIRKTKTITFINVKNLDTISAERAAKTMQRPIIDENRGYSILSDYTLKKFFQLLNRIIFIDIKSGIYKLFQ